MNLTHHQEDILTMCQNFRQDLVIPQASHAPKPKAHCFRDNDDCMRVPQYIVMGMVKCGTATLQKIAVQHPRIHTHKTPEVHFFNNRETDEEIRDMYQSYLAILGNQKLESKSQMNLSESFVIGEHTPE